MHPLPKGSHPDSILLTFTVAPEHAGTRLDRYIQSRIPRLSRTRAAKIVKACGRRADGTPRRPSERVKRGEVVLIVRPPMNEPDAPTTYGIIYEDDAVLVVDKPAGLPMHPTATYHRNTLLWLMKQNYGEENAPQLAHRLDKETSGVVICGKTREAERALKRSFERREPKKEYLAIVRGKPDPSGAIQASMGPAREGLHILMEVREDGLKARTEYEVLESRARRSLVSLRPHTGRQHQLRVHLASIGHPIVGDKLYGPDGSQPFLDHIDSGMTPALLARLGHPRQALHAHRLVIPHPDDGQPREYVSPFPEELLGLLAEPERDEDAL